MHVRVLGSAAGGGVPQWNCRCPVCSLVWNGDRRVRPRSQSSLAVSADGISWVLLNASPDLRQQILSTKALQPSGLQPLSVEPLSPDRPVLSADSTADAAEIRNQSGRHSPIKAVYLTNGDVDHIAGLLNLRERQSFELFGTRTTLDIVRSNSVFAVLNPENVNFNPVGLDIAVEILPGLQITPFAAPGKIPLYLEQGDVMIGQLSESVLGLEIRAEGKRMLYIPGCAEVTPDILARSHGADLLFFDGTTFTDDEMLQLQLSEKTARRMGHVAMSGEGGSLKAFAETPIGHKIYIHINNTNPSLIEGSPEHEAVLAAGWEIAHDGLEIDL